MSSTSDFFDCPKCGHSAHREQDNKTCDVWFGCSNCDWKGETVSMRKVTVELKVKILLNVDEDVEISEVVDELDYCFGSA
jgi:ribosomal protein L37AE/L43A